MELSAIHTPLQWVGWELALQQHRDRVYTNYIVQGIQDGFKIGFNHPNAQLKPKRHNLQSAYKYTTVVSQYLMEECKHKHTLGPFSSPRLILDLSSPDGCSVNNGIDSSTCSLDYISIDTSQRPFTSWGTAPSLQNPTLSMPIAKSQYIPKTGLYWTCSGMITGI